ncbi:hypothetical protein L5G32_03515 [Gordonia sp. HY002]|uniref:DUF2231 domain-containing protein n=1 Tax=Gordonia zhenghanii TaxID=2911516 RepID=UPI001EF0E84B|nr:DUF2231 domain-containing protein [Gordonia zhenghanii]MCF8569335.1 hypothetical protein [Gordonia zhenghanii]MCF8604378.1 hypothetical protein [Gordonia zhenghanii]
MDTIDGLPVHPLIVHLVVVIVPLAALAVIVAAVWPRARAWMGPMPAILALIGLIVTPIATTAGENLEHRLGLASPAVEEHTSAGDVVIVGTGCLFGAAALLYLIGLPLVTERLKLSPSVVKAVDVVARVLGVVAAIAAVYLVFRAGDTGARAVWGV